MLSYTKKYLIFLFSLLVIFPLQLSARHYPNGLEADSVDPKGDAVSIRQVRRKMDSIRRYEHRPTVALVLCGGGAKGAAEVGALRLLEEMQIPIDLVCGTSIGSLLGGLYAVGYDRAFLENLMRTADWEKLLSDKVETKYISLYTKDYKAKYPLAIPFHYAKKQASSGEVNQESYKSTDGKLHIEDGKDDIATREGMTSIAGSLPSGYVYGFNVNNLFSSLTVGYHDRTSFSELPIPFCCVATDIVSCKAKNWTDGHLKQAMRSSMGIPGMFSSVRTDGMVLVDGGLRNNFPVDIAKAMGADYIIGIDISDKYADASNVNNAGTVIYQFIDMMTRDTYELNLDKLSVHIRPNTVGYSSLSFSADAVDTLIRRGYEAAVEKRPELEKIKAAVGRAVTTLHRRAAVNINETPVTVSSIEFDGLSRKDAAYLLDRINLDITRKVSAADIENAMSIIEASTAVETVTYSLLGTWEPYRLVFSCTPAPAHRLGLAVRLDTECWAEVGVNFGLNVNKLSGPKLDADLKLGISQGLRLHFMYDVPGFPAINAEVKFDNKNADLLRGKYALETLVFSHEEKLYVSQNSRAQAFEFQAGLRNYNHSISRDRIASMVYLDSAILKGNYLGFYLSGRFNTMDRIDFPAKGVDVSAVFNNDFAKSGVRSFKPIRTLAADFRSVVPMGEKFAFVPDVHLRHIFAEDQNYYLSCGSVNPSYSPVHTNMVGGDIKGRYFEHQIPFIGFGDYTCLYKDDGGNVQMMDHIMVMNAEIRFSPVKNLYFSALGGYIHSAATLKNFYTFKDVEDIFAGGLQAAYHTVVGPLKFRVAYSDRVKGGSFKDNIYLYLSAGFGF